MEPALAGFCVLPHHRQGLCQGVLGCQRGFLECTEEKSVRVRADPSALPRNKQVLFPYHFVPLLWAMGVLS